MNKFSIFPIIVGILCFSFVLTDERVKENPIKKLKSKTIERIHIPKPIIIDMTMDAFLKELAFKESSGDWKCVNKYGYIGLYQFGRSALKDAGYKHIKTKEFINNPNIFSPKEQNKAIISLLKKNLHYLRRYTKYDRKVVGGVYVTISGMLAASHLVGSKSVRRFLKSGGKYDLFYANGVRCSDYMKHFRGYYLILPE